MNGMNVTGAAELSASAIQQSVERLLALPDNDVFLRSAYQLILGRGIDGDGQRFYTRRLQDGVPRRDLIWEIAKSEEGRTNLANQPVLRRVVSQLFGGQQLGELSIAQLLSLPHEGFFEVCAELFADGTLPPPRAQQLLTELRSGKPRHKLLLALADASGRSSFPEVQGLDAFLARARTELFPVAESVMEILNYEGVDFVDCAYNSVLGRKPDSAGAEYYLDRLRAGYSRTSIIVALARSTEARAHDKAPTGLRSACLRYWVANVLLRARWAAWLFGTESDRPYYRRQRQLDGLARRIDILETQLASISPGLSSDRATAKRSDFDYEALIDIQRDNFERETTALRKLVARIAIDHTQSSPLGRGPLRERRVSRPKRRL